MRKLVIGDIHGGYKALLQVLERSGFDNSKDQLICLGDYVDGWSETAEVIQHLIDLQKESNNRHIFIKGNHDEWCREWLIHGNAHWSWLKQGGQATFDSYIRTGFLVSDDHRDFFSKLHNYYIDDENRGFVHGGFVSKNGLGHDANQTDYYWDRDLWGLALLQHNNYHEASEEAIKKIRRFEKHKEIYIGHTSTVNWNIKPHYPEYSFKEQSKNGVITTPMNRCNIWNMDTGGGFMGKLTIMDIDTKEFWQSDNLKELYPNETGR